MWPGAPSAFINKHKIFTTIASSAVEDPGLPESTRPGPAAPAAPLRRHDALMALAPPRVVLGDADPLPVRFLGGGGGSGGAVAVRRQLGARVRAAEISLHPDVDEGLLVLRPRQRRGSRRLGRLLR